jgi:predicted oxidoreductase
MTTPLVTNQIELSLLARTAFTDGDIAHLQRLGVRPMAWSPLAGGALFGDGAAATRLAPVLARLAGDAGVAPDAVAVAWLLAHPCGILPVMGTNALARIARLGDAARVTIDRETWFELWTAAAGAEVP